MKEIRSSCRNVVNSLLKEKKNDQNPLSNKSSFFINISHTIGKERFLRKIYLTYTSRLCIVNFIESKNNFVNSTVKNILPNILFSLIVSCNIPSFVLPLRRILEKLVQSFKKQS